MININVGQKIAFREDFKQSFDGSTSFPFENSFLSNTPTFSLYLIIRPIIDSSRNVILSFGNNLTNNILIEIGISTNNKLFAYNGTTEVETGDALISNTTYYVTAVYKNNLLTFYINNELYPTGLDLNTIEGIDLIIGESIAGNDYYEGYLDNVVLFVEEHDRTLANTITGYGTAPDWTPADLFVGAEGSWYTADDSYLVAAASPSLVDGDMEALNTSAWSSVDATLSKELGSPGGIGSQVLRVTSAFSTYFSDQFGVFITGNRYNVTGWGRSSSIDKPGVWMWANQAWEGIGSTTWQQITGDATATATAIRLGSSGASVGSYLEFDDISVENLSRTQWNPKNGTLGGNLAQATPANQPWWDLTNNGVKFGETDDYIVSNLPAGDWTPLHYKAGNGVYNAPNMFIAMVAEIDTLSTNGFFRTGYANGIRAHFNPDGSIQFWVHYGGSGNRLDAPAGTVTTTKALFTFTSDAIKTSIRKNGVEIVSSNYIGSCSSADPDVSLWLGNLTGTNGLLGAIYETIILFKSDDNSISTTEQYLINKYSII